MHGCGGTAQGMFRASTLPASADRLGFIVIYPATTKQQNCWDNHSPASNTRDGGSDPQSLIQMVNYTLDRYNGDASRVFAMGISSGGMMTSLIASVYPDVFEAGAVFSGVPAHCFLGAGASYPGQSNSSCVNAEVIHTPQEWGNFVRNAYPGYRGQRPRMQLWHGTADSLVKYGVLAEEAKQWSNVFGLSLTRTQSGSPSSAYTRQIYGSGSQMDVYTGSGVGHTVPIQVGPMLDFFGLS